MSPRFLILIFCVCLCSACQSLFVPSRIVISIPAQTLELRQQGRVWARYPISTAKRGVGDVPDSFMTPAGELVIAEKIGAGLPAGSVLKDRIPTGEIVGIDAPGRDPIVTRILWLRGLEARNQNAYARNIYIHGTPQESLLGQAVSYGCVRIRSSDIVELFERVSEGTPVTILE